MASYEEAFQVTAHDAHQEIQAQARAQSPAAVPGDPWRSARHTLGGTGRPRRAGRRSGLRRRLRAWHRSATREG